MNIIEISKESIDSFRYEEIRGFVSYLEQNPEKNKGTLVIQFPELETEKDMPIFLDKALKAWYVGLMYNTPHLLYYLSDMHDGKRQWTDLQFAMMMFGDIQVKSNDKEYLSFEVKIHEEIFQTIVQHTADYLMKVSEKEGISQEEKDFFSHLIFDYTNGFYNA